MAALPTMPVLDGGAVLTAQELAPDDKDTTKNIIPSIDVPEQQPYSKRQRRANVYAMLAGGAGLLTDGYQNSLVSVANKPKQRVLTSATASNGQRHLQKNIRHQCLHSAIPSSDRQW